MGKGVKRLWPSRRGRFGKLQEGKQESKAKELGPTRNTQNQGCLGTVEQSGHFYDTAGQGIGKEWPEPLGTRTLLYNKSQCLGAKIESSL